MRTKPTSKKWFYGPKRMLRVTGFVTAFVIFCNIYILLPLVQQTQQWDDAVPKKFFSLEDRMRDKLSRLSKPPWPQQDDRIARAIAHGTVLGPPANATMSTIISAYYEFESKHSVKEYEAWFQRLLQAPDPLIIFLEPESRWISFVSERRKHAPTIIALVPFDQLVMSTTFAESLWQEQRKVDLEAKVHKGTGVYKIWNEKLIFIHAAIQLNPFDSPTFTWMDAGYFRQKRRNPTQPIVNLNITDAGVHPSKVLLLHVRGDGLDRTGKDRVAIAGNSFSGTPEAFLEFYDKYYITMWDWITKGIFVGSDQFVMTETCYRYPSVCHPTFPGRFRNWFYMAAILEKTECDLQQVSDNFFFGSPPDNNPPPFPQGVVSTMKGLT
mmetsp:Transcript_32571/g.43296  ORF Transcript_32571/g.43296 Transcript_32571/m.43296 type:complete len:381 (+) Transcript_32571:134-1276(+)